MVCKLRSQVTACSSCEPWLSAHPESRSLGTLPARWGLQRPIPYSHQRSRISEKSVYTVAGFLRVPGRLTSLSTAAGNPEAAIRLPARRTVTGRGASRPGTDCAKRHECTSARIELGGGGGIAASGLAPASASGARRHGFRRNPATLPGRTDFIWLPIDALIYCR